MSIFNHTLAQPANAAEYDAEVIANATSWTAFQKRGRGVREKASAATRDGAVEAAKGFLRDCPNPVLIYAVTDLGRQAHAETVSR